MSFSIMTKVFYIKKIKNLKQNMRGIAENHEAPMKHVLGSLGHSPAWGLNSAHHPQGQRD